MQTETAGYVSHVASGMMRGAKEISLSGELIDWKVGEFDSASGRRTYGVQIRYRNSRGKAMAIRQTGSITRPASVTAASSQKQAAVVQDRMDLSQGQAIHVAPDLSREQPFTEADSAATIERSMKLPSYALRKAYGQKMEWMEKRSIDKKFWRPESEQDRKQHREFLFQ